MLLFYWTVSSLQKITGYRCKKRYATAELTHTACTHLMKQQGKHNIAKNTFCLFLVLNKRDSLFLKFDTWMNSKKNKWIKSLALGAYSSVPLHISSHLSLSLSWFALNKCLSFVRLNLVFHWSKATMRKNSYFGLLLNRDTYEMIIFNNIFPSNAYLITIHLCLNLLKCWFCFYFLTLI